MKKSSDIARLRTELLNWYDRSGRTLPWRVRPEDRASGQKPDPYAVWLSEIMLQQTTVPHATPYWHKFLKAFPRVEDLAQAEQAQVLAMWAGLGYYARARNLHKCAKVVTSEFDGSFPRTEAALLKLPGIGPYTAATMAAICFDEPTNIVDGNVERVISRMFRVETPLPKSKTELRNLAETIADPGRPGDYGQALMDLGATICTPKNPDCGACPWNWACLANIKGDQLAFPKKLKKARPVRYGAAFALLSGDEILLRRRPEKGLLGGMLELPGSPWEDAMPGNALDFAPAQRNWEKCEGQIKHVFTHFELRLDIYRAETASKIDGLWVPHQNLSEYAVPTLTKKAIIHAINT